MSQVLAEICLAVTQGSSIPLLTKKIKDGTGVERHCFSEKNLVDWMILYRFVDSISEAVDFGNFLLIREKLCLISSKSGTTSKRFLYGASFFAICDLSFEEHINDSALLECLDVYLFRMRWNGGIELTKNWKNLRSYDKSFLGSAIVSWFIIQGVALTSSVAKYLAEKLIHMNAIVPLSDAESGTFEFEGVYGFSPDLPDLDQEKVLRQKFALGRMTKILSFLQFDFQFLHLILQKTTMLTDKRRSPAEEREKKFFCPAAGCFISSETSYSAQQECPFHQIALVPESSVPFHDDIDEHLESLSLILSKYCISLPTILKSVFHGSERHAHALAVELFWEILKLRNQNHVCADKRSCSICFHMDESFCDFIMTNARGLVFNNFIRSSILVAMFHQPWSLTKPIALDQVIQRPRLCKGLFSCLAGASSSCVIIALKDINVLLSERDENCGCLIESGDWISWILPLLFEEQPREPKTELDGQIVSIFSTLMAFSVRRLSGFRDHMSRFLMLIQKLGYSSSCSVRYGYKVLYGTISRIQANPKLFPTVISFNETSWCNLRQLFQICFHMSFCSSVWGDPQTKDSSEILRIDSEVMPSSYGLHYQENVENLHCLKIIEKLQQCMISLRIHDGETLKLTCSDDKFQQWATRTREFIEETIGFLLIIQERIIAQGPASVREFDRFIASWIQGSKSDRSQILEELATLRSPGSTATVKRSKRFQPRESMKVFMRPK
jgi:hypothetical protein